MPMHCVTTTAKWRKRETPKTYVNDINVSTTTKKCAKRNGAPSTYRFCYFHILFSAFYHIFFVSSSLHIYSIKLMLRKIYILSKIAFLIVDTCMLAITPVYSFFWQKAKSAQKNFYVKSSPKHRVHLPKIQYLSCIILL